MAAIVTHGHRSHFWSVGVMDALQVSIERCTGESLPEEKVRFLHAPLKVTRIIEYSCSRRINVDRRASRRAH